MKLLFFGPLRELISEQLTAPDDLKDPITVADLRTWVGEQYPQARPLLQSSAVVIDLEYADDDDEVHVQAGGNQEIGFIPPVSSG